MNQPPPPLISTKGGAKPSAGAKPKQIIMNQIEKLDTQARVIIAGDACNKFNKFISWVEINISERCGKMQNGKPCIVFKSNFNGVNFETTLKIK